PLPPPLLPYTTLFRSDLRPQAILPLLPGLPGLLQPLGGPAQYAGFVSHGLASLLLPLPAEKFPHALQILPHPLLRLPGPGRVGQDRKSTRLNSSHVSI